MKKVVKKNYKMVIGLVIGILISATVVYASQTVLMGNEISYDNGTSHGTSNDVQGALDDLYGKLNIYKNINYIATVKDLEKLREEVNKGDSKEGQRYALISDLDLGGKFDENGSMLNDSTNWDPIGTAEHPFSGTFDGMGHIIKNLYINIDNKYVGLFGYVKNGTIKNLGIEDSYSTGNSNDIAILVGALNNSTIDSCYNKGNVKGNIDSAGLVGYSFNNSIISNCYNTGKIDNNSKQFAGGIVGYASGGTIKNCYNVGEIKGGLEIGGIAGALLGDAINTYNLGEISGDLSGGIVGQLFRNGSIKNSYNSGTSLGGIVGNIYTNSNQKLENNYYLNTSASWGIDNVDNNSNFTLHSDNNTTPLAQDKMPEVLKIINGDNAFISDTNKNNGNPILKWESKK